MISRDSTSGRCLYSGSGLCLERWGSECICPNGLNPTAINGNQRHLLEARGAEVGADALGAVRPGGLPTAINGN